MRAAGNTAAWIVLGVLVVMHYGLRPLLGDHRYAPDLLLLALLLYAMRSRPGAGAVAGFLVGVVSDAVAPTSFGAAALACTLAGYLSSWVRSVFVAESFLVTAAFVAGATWVRDAVQLLAANQHSGKALLWQLSTWSLLTAVTTAAAALLVLLVAGRRLEPRRSA